MKNRKKLVSILAGVMAAVLVLTLILSLLPTRAYAASSSEIRKQITGLQEQRTEMKSKMKELESQYQENKDEISNIVAKKNLIDQEMTLLHAQVDNINEQITAYGVLVADKQDELDTAEDRLEALNQENKERIRTMEEEGTLSYWEVLFKANSFADLLSRIDSIHEVAAADQRMLEQMQEMADQITRDRQELESDLAEQEEAKALLAEREATLQTQREEADTLLQELKVQTDNLTAEYEANEAAEAEARQAVMDMQAKYEAALSAEQAARLAEQNKNNVAGSGSSNTTNVTPSTSGFVKPLGSYTVTCAYGWRIHPIWGDRRFHSGVDLAASQGSPIYAIAAGTVTTATYGNANGYYVAISHGNGYGSLYAHMTNYVVSVGDYVSQGQVIGYVGSTGWSTGPHLHFEIHVNGSTVNPMDYIG